MKKLWKRTMCLLLAALLMIGSLSVAMAVSNSSTHAKKGDEYVVLAKTLNLRSGAGMGNNVVKLVKRGEKLTYLGQYKGWWNVRLSSGKTGYVDKQYLAPVNACTTGSYKVTRSLWVRISPNDSAKKIRSVAKGKTVTVTKLNGDWGYISEYHGWALLNHMSH